MPSFVFLRGHTIDFIHLIYVAHETNIVSLFFYLLCWLAMHLREGNALNLNINTLGKLVNSNAAASGLVSEPLGVLLVHGLKSV